MRINTEARAALVQSVRSVAPDAKTIRLFGSRLDDHARGGDVDLMVEFDHPIERPALLAARIGVQVSRILAGRSVDVVLKAPNLKECSIHRVATATGIAL
jgi:predicted nucleotidyltransferase